MYYHNGLYILLITNRADESRTVKAPELLDASLARVAADPPWKCSKLPWILDGQVRLLTSDQCSEPPDSLENSC